MTELKKISKKYRAFGACFVLSMLLPTSSSVAQELPSEAQWAPADSASLLRSVLEERRNDLARLERMLEGLNTIDSVYRVHYPMWTVIDEDLRQRILRAFRLRHPEVMGDSAITVVANPVMTEIVQISNGAQKLGRLEAGLTLSDSLEKMILSRKYPLRPFFISPSKQRQSVLFGSRPKAVAVDASAYGASLLFSSGWGVEAKLGIDEIGYPFWSAGSARVHAIFNQVKVGVLVPVKFGRKEPQFMGPLSIRPRKLNGSTGFSLEYDQPFRSHVISLRFAVGELNRYLSGFLTDEQRPYYLHTVGQLTYTRNANLLGEGHYIKLTGGIGFHQIARGEVLPNERIVATSKSNYISPILRVEYTRQADRMYGFTLQYYGSLISLHAWLEVVKNFIYLDARYSTPAFRDPRPWEQPYFYMVSPRFRVAF